MNIYIKIEVKRRELESRLLLAMVAAENGHDVLLGSTLLTFDLVKKKILKPGVILEKSIVPSAKRIQELKDFKKRNCKITVIDEEGGFINNEFNKFMEERFSLKTIKLTDKIFTWGVRDFKKFSQNFKKYKDKFSPTGNPRVDFWRKEFFKYYEIQKLDQIKQSDKFILVASNFGAMLHERRISEEVRVLREKKNFERGRDEFLYYDYKSYQIKLAAKFVKAIRQISKQFKNLKIVVRPHPTESVSAWKTILGQYNNIYVIQDGSIGKWIRKAKLVLHNSCTSGIESYISGVPVIAYRPFRSNFDFKFPNSLSVNAFDEKNLIKEISKILNKKKNNKLKVNKVDYYFANLINKFASENIVKEWEKLDDGKLSEKNNFLKLKIISNLKEFKGKIVNEIFSNQNKKLNHDSAKYKFPKITNQELDLIVTNLRKTLNRFKNVSVEKISDRLILIKKKYSL